MSLLTKALQQKDETRRPSMAVLNKGLQQQVEARRPSMAPPGKGLQQQDEARRPSMAVLNKGLQQDDARRPSMAVKMLSVPGGSSSQTPRRTSSVELSGSKTSPAPRRSGPSLIGLLASKRLAKKLTSRFRHGSTWGMQRNSQAVQIQKEPTYRMEPHNKFHPGKVEEVLKKILEERAGKMRYSAKICPNMCKILSEEIKERVKQLNFDRYKIVCSVMIGQRGQQGLQFSSRCAWDERLDNFASYTTKNEHIICTATVFGVYTD